MSFLRSIITDAQSHNSKSGSSNGSSEISGLMTHRLGGDLSGGNEKSSVTSEQANDLSTSLPIREGVSNFNIVDAPVNRVEQNIQDLGSNIELESSFTMPVDKGRPILDEASSIRSVKGLETLTIQADETQITALTSPKNDLRDELSVLETSLATSESLSSPTLGAAATIVSHGVDGVLQQPDESRMDNVTDSVNAQAPTQDNSARWNGAKQVLSGVGNEPKDVQRDIRSVLRQAITLASQESPDMELTSVTPSASKKELTSPGSSSYSDSQPGTPEQHVVIPVRRSVSPDALRTVPATLFQTESIPKAGDTFGSRQSLRSPKKMPEAAKVQIGQIDVIIEAAAQPATKLAPSSSPIDFASRHYLRRL